MQEKNEIINVKIKYERLDDEIENAANNKRRQDLNTLLGHVVNSLDIGRNIKKVVDPNLEYAVKFPAALLKKMDEHDVQFLTDSVTGELLPDLYDYTEKGIGGKIRLEIKGKPTAQDWNNLSMYFNNLIEQNRYDMLIEQIQEIRAVAKEIERGQDRDRFAKVNAGRKMLLDAINVKDDDAMKRDMMLKAVGLLREGRELIESTLMEKLDSLEMIPQNKAKRLIKCFVEPTYFDTKTEEFYDVQEYFKYYYMSIEPMAYTYTCLGQPHLVDILLEDSKKVFEHDKISCLSSIELLLPHDDFNNMWYRDSEKCEQKLLASYKEFNHENDLYITIKGNELLEVINNDREE